MNHFLKLGQNELFPIIIGGNVGEILKIYISCELDFLHSYNIQAK